MALDLPPTIALTWALGGVVGALVTPLGLGLFGVRFQIDDHGGALFLWLVWPIALGILALALTVMFWSEGLNSTGLWLHRKGAAFLAKATGAQS